LWLGLDAEEVSRAVGDRAHVVDVEGKWAVFRCEDSVARQALSSVVDIDTVLEPRACATLTLFDCPAVLLRAGGEGYVICVHSSYAASFEAAFRAALDASGGAARPGDSDGAVRMSDNSGGFG
jgi:sarcosine oxidase gamma subunit